MIKKAGRIAFVTAAVLLTLGATAVLASGQNSGGKVGPDGGILAPTPVADEPGAHVPGGNPVATGRVLEPALPPSSPVSLAMPPGSGRVAEPPLPPSGRGAASMLPTQGETRVAEPPLPPSQGGNIAGVGNPFARVAEPPLPPSPNNPNMVGQPPLGQQPAEPQTQPAPLTKPSVPFAPNTKPAVPLNP